MVIERYGGDGLPRFANAPLASIWVKVIVSLLFRCWLFHSTVGRLRWRRLANRQESPGRRPLRIHASFLTRMSTHFPAEQSTKFFFFFIFLFFSIISSDLASVILSYFFLECRMARLKFKLWTRESPMYFISFSLSLVRFQLVSALIKSDGNDSSPPQPTSHASHSSPTSRTAFDLIRIGSIRSGLIRIGCDQQLRQVFGHSTR